MEYRINEEEVKKLGYYEKLQKGVCPECDRVHDIRVEETTEYNQHNQPETFTVVRCQGCGKSWLPTTLM